MENGPMTPVLAIDLAATFWPSIIRFHWPNLLRFGWPNDERFRHLVSKDGSQMIIDAKYKLHYQNSHLHQDIRQVAGYARLNKVRDKLKVIDDSNIDCLIIYPDIENGIDDFTLVNIIDKRDPIKVYNKVYKLGVKLPLIS